MRCRFKHKIFQNEENGYTIAIFTTQDTSVPLSARDKYLASRNIIGFSAIGFGLPLTDEIELEMEGRWESGEHGTQYQVENFMEVVPRTKEGILGYLSSGAIKGIGPKMADTIFRKFGLQTLEIMENNPQELLKIRGISEKKLAAIVESYGKNQVFRELMTFLAPFKVTPKKVNMILKKFGNESVDIIRHRPYMLSAVKGFGFLTVDAIGRQCCCALNDPMRISGCIGHIMNQAMRCRFKHKIFQNEENGYTIAIFTTQDTSVPLSARDKYLASRNIIGFSAIGFGLPLTDEIELEMEGRWESGEHGTQYQVENFMEVVPRTKEGILGYLSSGAIKGIGPKMADTIFRKFGLQTLEIMENNPQELLKIRGISEKKLAAIVESYGKNQVFRELMTFLAPFKVTPKKVNMILKKFGNESVDIIRHRPYMLSAVKGFGFLTVDAIGRQCCCALNDPMRISGCIGHIMNQAMKEGHLFKQRQEVIREALEMLNRDLQVMAVSEQDVSQVLYRLVLQKSIVVEEERIYSIRQYEEETQTASMIARRLLEKPVLLSIEPELEKAQKTLGITLSETQKQAVRMVFAHPISIITGGPGTGKTTVLKVILYIHQALCRSEVQLMAPTGRAARRMVESTGCENASTMHLALGLLGDDTDFEPDFEYLSAGFLNVDEVSMVDMHLAYEFFRRVSRHARVLLVGDKNQLPSVGAGDVFRQLIACGLIPVTVLDLVYRQGVLSSIPYNAKLMQENKTNLSFGEDFQFIACKGADEAAEIVRRIYLDEIAKNGMDQVQILTPYRKRSAAGVDELNKSLEDFVNPPIAGKKELHIGSQVFRVGDKILQNKNTEMASNGDLGRILDCITDEDGNARAVIGFPDGRQVQYEADQMEMIEHANATTIHKAQGSECPVVIIPWVKAFYMMLKRNILYTGVTRAKSKVYLVGEWAAVCQAIHTDDSGTRNTILSERIVQYYDQYQSEQKPEMEQLKLVV